jgi:transcriptional regulator with XRE-family HTH domain
MFVAHPRYLRERARELRTERKLSLLEIAERLALPRTDLLLDPRPRGPGDQAPGHAWSEAGEKTYMFQYHADQDPEYLVRFWSSGLGVDPGLIRPQRKSNSGQLSGRTWRCKHGVLTVRASDTALRMRLQAWIDRQQDGWLDSLFSGV